MPGSETERRLQLRAPLWRWLIGLAIAWGLVPVVMAVTVHDRCRAADPACIFHSYTLVETAGPWILVLIGAPAVLALVVAGALHLKVARRSERADQVAWTLAVVSCLVCFVGLIPSGFVMLVEAALTLGATATAPLPADPDDPLLSSSVGGRWRRQRENTREAP